MQVSGKLWCNIIYFIFHCHKNIAWNMFSQISLVEYTFKAEAVWEWRSENCLHKNQDADEGGVRES